MKMTLLAVLTLTAWVETAFSADTPAPQKTIGINPAYRNLSVKPGDDFEEYANGGWRKTAEIPPDRASTGAGFEVFQRAEQRTANLVREVAGGNPQSDTPQGMIANYYAAFMDTANIEKRGLDPLKEKLREIEQIATKADLARVLGQRLRADVDPLPPELVPDRVHRLHPAVHVAGDLVVAELFPDRLLDPVDEVA